MPDVPNKRGTQDRNRESQQEYEQRYRESEKEEQSGNRTRLRKIGASQVSGPDGRRRKTREII